jgi:hypothetical protein
MSLFSIGARAVRVVQSEASNRAIVIEGPTGPGLAVDRPHVSLARACAAGILTDGGVQ